MWEREKIEMQSTARKTLKLGILPDRTVESL